MSQRDTGRRPNRFLRMPIRAYLKPLILLALTTALATGSAPALAAPVDFTIGIPGKTGCLVCHGDPKLTQIKSKESLYISESEMLASVHKDVPCTKCHTDFDSNRASQSHLGLKTDSSKVAGLACKNCHEHASQLKVYDTSVHGRKALGGDMKAPTCADCHGSHAIKSLKKDKAYKQEFRANAEQVCGRCHQKYYDSYNDYYHGRAYKMKAADAPTCWDCHGAHDILPAKNTESKVAASNLATTCGKCHVDSRAGFTKYAKLIHGRQTVVDKNPVFKYKKILVEWFKKTVPGVAKAAGTGGTAASKK